MVVLGICMGCGEIAVTPDEASEQSTRALVASLAGPQEVTTWKESFDTLRKPAFRRFVLALFNDGTDWEQAGAAIILGSSDSSGLDLSRPLIAAIRLDKHEPAFIGGVAAFLLAKTEPSDPEIIELAKLLGPENTLTVRLGASNGLLGLGESAAVAEPIVAEDLRSPGRPYLIQIRCIQVLMAMNARSENTIMALASAVYRGGGQARLALDRLAELGPAAAAATYDLEKIYKQRILLRRDVPSGKARTARIKEVLALIQHK